MFLHHQRLVMLHRGRVGGPGHVPSFLRPTQCGRHHPL